MFFCHRDREDVDRIQERLNKEIYDTLDEKRPYKVVIEPSEMEEVTEILLENENNRQDSKELEI